MIILFLCILAIACLIALTSERYALGAVLLIGFIQDPFRKLVAGEPIYFIVTVAVVFGVLLLKTVNSLGIKRIVEPFVSWVGYIQTPLFLFSLILFIQFLHSVFRWGSVIVGMIGMVSYVAPLLAIIVGYQAINSLNDARAFMKVYVLFGLIVGLSVALSFSGVELSMFREVGVGLKIYDQGTVLRSFSGLMRTGEIAAWHLATTTCFIVILYVTSNRKPSLILIVSLVLFLMLAIAFTGRRKMLMLVTLFGLFFTFGFYYYRRALSATSVLASCFIVFVLWLGLGFLFPDGYSSDVQNYLARGSSVYNGASERFFELGLSPIKWAINRVGWFGGGLGIASQGSQFFHSVSIAGGSGEGGLGKVMVELGLPGLLVIMWLVIAFSRYVLRCLSLVSQHFVQPGLMVMGLGASVFLLVNIMTFSVATQVYGDIFVLLMLGLVTGVVFATPKLVAQGMREEEQLSLIRSNGKS